MPEPSPVGGMKVIAKMFYDDNVFENSQHIHFNSSFKEASKIKRLVQSFTLRYEFVKLLKKEKPTGVYIYTSSFMGFYDKTLYCLLSKWAGVKSSLNIVGGGFFDFYESNAINRTLVKACMKIPTTIVIGSKSWEESVKKEFTPKNLAIVHNPVIPVSNPKEKHSFINNKVNFLFFGRLAEPKGVKDIVNVLQKLNSDTLGKMVFTFAGKGPLGNYIKTELKDLISKDIVELFEDVSDEQKEALMQKANVFVLPSHVEVLPISLLEAMSNKLPAIVTAVGGMPDAVTEGQNGFLIPQVSDTENKLPALLNYFIENKDKIDQMGEASLQKIKDQFSFEVILKKSVATFH